MTRRYIQYLNESRTALRILVVLLVMPLLSCSTTHDARPQAIIDAETQMQRGTAAYIEDRYAVAARHFSQALQLYHSLDHQPGILSSLSNLAETAIAIGNYSQAEDLLHQLQNQHKLTTDTAHKNRIQLLHIKLLFHQQDYAQAIRKLSPLLPEFNDQQQSKLPMPLDLNIISTMARLMSITDHVDSNLWNRRFQQAMAQQPESPRYQALWLRLQAEALHRNGDPDQALQRLQQALQLSKQQAHRRGIAASLQHMARIQVSRDEMETAVGLYERALKIQLWTTNKTASEKIMQQLKALHQTLGNHAKALQYQQQLNELEQAEAVPDQQ